MINLIWKKDRKYKAQKKKDKGNNMTFTKNVLVNSGAPEG